jgi:hypothetical protein
LARNVIEILLRIYKGLSGARGQVFIELSVIRIAFQEFEWIHAPCCIPFKMKYSPQNQYEHEEYQAIKNQSILESILHSYISLFPYYVGRDWRWLTLYLVILNVLVSDHLQKEVEGLGELKCNEA